MQDDYGLGRHTDWIDLTQAERNQYAAIIAKLESGLANLDRVIAEAMLPPDKPSAPVPASPPATPHAASSTLRERWRSLRWRRV